MHSLNVRAPLGRINQQALSQNHANGSPSQLGGGGLISVEVAGHPHAVPPSSTATNRQKTLDGLHSTGELPAANRCPRYTPTYTTHS